MQFEVSTQAYKGDSPDEVPGGGYYCRTVMTGCAAPRSNSKEARLAGVDHGGNAAVRRSPRGELPGDSRTS